MSMSLNAALHEQVRPVVAAAGLLLTSTLGDTTYVSMKGYARAMVIITIADGTTVTGSTITLKQATDVTNSQSDEKALAFTKVWKNVDIAAGQTFTETAVTSNTFDTQAVNSKISCYILDIKASDLDVANGFDCFRVDGTGHAATNSLGSQVLYLMFGPRYSGLTPLTN